MGAGVVVLYGLATNFVPTGADPGNWLAVAFERLGREVTSADVTYLPVFPGLLAVLLTMLEPVPAFAAISILTILSILTAVYLCARTLGRGVAVVAAILIGTAGIQTEAYAWGGYPQLLATAFGLIATFSLLRHFETRDRRHLWSGVVLGMATVATHAMIGGLLVGAILLAGIYWALSSEISNGDTYVWTVILLTSTASFLAVLTSRLSSAPGVVPTLNPERVQKLDALFTVIQDAPLPWLLILAAAIAAPFIRNWSSPIAATIAVGWAWAISALGFFVITGEPRALLVAQVGILLPGMAGSTAVFSRLRKMRFESRQSLGKATKKLVIVAAISMLSAAVIGGLAAFVSATDWYRLVGHSEIAAFDQLKARSESGDLALASRGHHSMPVGWWIEGYAGLPAYSGHDVAYLAFPDEREQAELANHFFGGDLSYDVSIDFLSRIGADFVAVDRRGPDASWLRSDIAQRLNVVDDSSFIVILEVPVDG